MKKKEKKERKKERKKGKNNNNKKRDCRPWVTRSVWKYTVIDNCSDEINRKLSYLTVRHTTIHITHSMQNHFFSPSRRFLIVFILFSPFRQSNIITILVSQPYFILFLNRFNIRHENWSVLYSKSRRWFITNTIHLFNKTWV